MSDEEQDQAPDVDTPVADQTNWQKRYEDLQPEFTRKSQEAAQYQQLVEALQSEDEDTRNQAAQILGFEFASTEPEPEPFYEDPGELALQQLAELQAQLQARDSQAQQEAQLAQAQAHMDAQLGAIEGLDDTDRDWISTRAVVMYPQQANGFPDIEAAYKDLQAWEQERMKKWASTKNAPRFNSGGQQATSAPNLDDPNERVAWMMQQLEDRE